MYEYHVTFMGSKKVVKTERKESVIDSIRQAFDIKNTTISLQKYDKEWDDFVDATVEDLPEKAKLLVYVVSDTVQTPSKHI